MKTSSIMVLTALLAGVMAAAGARSEPALSVQPGDLAYGECDTVDFSWIENGGDGVLEWSITPVSWCRVEPASGSTLPGSEHRVNLRVVVDKSGLADGRQVTTLGTITSNGGSANIRALVITQHAPKLIAPDRLELTQALPSAPLVLKCRSEAPAAWSAVPSEPWMEVVPAFGSLEWCAHQTLTVNLIPSALPAPDQTQDGEIVIDWGVGSAVTAVTYYPQERSGGVIGLYADIAGNDCNIVQATPALKHVYVVHTLAVRVSGIEFAAPKPACWTNAMWLSDQDIFPVTIGNTQTGKSLGYGVCRTGTIHATTMAYFVHNPPTQFCCEYPVLPAPYNPSGQVQAADCVGGVIDAVGGVSMVNPTPDCYCGGVRVEESTWGRVKALYAPE